MILFGLFFNWINKFKCKQIKSINLYEKLTKIIVNTEEISPLTQNQIVHYSHKYYSLHITHLQLYTLGINGQFGSDSLGNKNQGCFVHFYQYFFLPTFA